MVNAFQDERSQSVYCLIDKGRVMKSPFEPAVPTVFMMNDKERSFNVINFKLSAATSVVTAVKKIETVFKKFAPNQYISGYRVR